jgi:hypothetical protein
VPRGIAAIACDTDASSGNGGSGASSLGFAAVSDGALDDVDDELAALFDSLAPFELFDAESVESVDVVGSVDFSAALSVFSSFAVFVRGHELPQPVVATTKSTPKDDHPDRDDFMGASVHPDALSGCVTSFCEHTRRSRPSAWFAFRCASGAHVLKYAPLR